MANTILLTTEETANIYSDGHELMSSNGDINIHYLNESVYTIVSGDKVTKITYNDSGYNLCSFRFKMILKYESMALGELGEMVLPLANTALVSYVVAQRYYNPNSGI